MKRNSLIFLLLAALFMPLALHAQQSLPYSCGFEEGDDLSGWALHVTNQNYSGLYNNESYAHSGTHAIGIYYDEENGYLVSPILTGGDNGINVSFWYYEISQQYGDEQFEVGYTTDESIEDPSQFTYDGDVVTASMEWQQYSFSFPAGTKRIAVHYIFNDALILFLDDFEFTATGAAVCNRPTGLTATNVGSRTATISWTSDASAWQLCVNDDEAHLINVNQTSYTLSGLTPDTEYTVKVRTNCGNNNFSAWTNVSFTTEVACPAPEVTIADITSTSANITWTGSANNYNLRYRNLTFFDDFESGELTNWTIYTEGEVGEGLEGWRIIDPTGGLSWTGHNGSTYVASAWSWSSSAYNANNWLITPQVQLGGILKFYVYTNQSYPDDYEVLLSTSGNAIDNFTVTLQAMASVPTTGDWVEVSIDLNAYAGQTGYIALHHQYYDGNYILVDDFGIFNRTWTTANGVTSPYAISGLTPETTYEVEVQAVCGGQDGSSEWSSTTFTTLPACLAPTDLTISRITTTSALVSWSGNANSYNLKVGNQTYNGVTSPYALSGLTAATIYTVEVQSVCSATSTSTWTSTEFITEFCEEADKCLLTFVLTDSYGDTWNNNAIAVVDAETNVIVDILTNDYDNYTATGASGAYTQTKTLAVCNGRQLQFVWVRGSYPGEASWVITDVNGEEITSGTGNTSMQTGDILATYTVDCTVTSCRKPTDLQIVDISANSVTLSWTENGEATAWMVWYSSGVRPTQVNVTETTLTINVNPETSYIARVRPVCDVNDKWSDDLAFTTPATCPLPSDIVVEAAARSATLSWTGSVDSYNVRYRLATAAGFDDGTLGDWTTIDADGDGNTWYALDVIPGHNESAGLVTSASYANVALTPDNYLVSPQVTLGGSISFYAGAQDASWPAEHFGVAISTTGNTDAADFTTIAEWTMNADGTGTEGPARAQGEWGLFTVDLSDYAGQTGYVAIRHFDCTDMFRLNVDEITITQPGVEIPWITLSTTETTITLPNLQMGTTYEYQMQSVCGGTPTAWTTTNFFTTLDGNVFITDGAWNNGNNWSGGTIPGGSSNVKIRANVTIPADYRAWADQITIDGGSITIADGGQLRHNTDDLEVTMEKTIPAYTGTKDNYKLLAFPFNDYPDVPEGMIATTGTDFYRFANSEVEEEWQNNQVTPINYVYPGPGYLYANPEGITLSMSGTTFPCYSDDDELYMNLNYDENENGDNSGWRLIGNPFTYDVAIWGQIGDGDRFPMDVMYYDENGDMQTIHCGPVAPMQGFFVKVTDTTTVYFYPDNSIINIGSDDVPWTDLPKRAISHELKMHKPAPQVISLDNSAYKNVTVIEKKANKTFIILDKKMEKKLVKKDAFAPFKNVIQFKPIKK